MTNLPGACRNVFRPEVKTVLITFGGTDTRDMARRTLECIEPLCRERGITIRVVAGPGYAHKDAMEARVAEIHQSGNPRVEFTYITNVMSRMMEGADLAICSAGRTVYELAHMRVPAMVLAHHEREARHTFARAHNGFAYLGIMDKVSDAKLRNVFQRLLCPSHANASLTARTTSPSPKTRGTWSNACSLCWNGNNAAAAKTSHGTWMGILLVLRRAGLPVFGARQVQRCSNREPAMDLSGGAFTLLSCETHGKEHNARHRPPWAGAFTFLSHEGMRADRA